MHEMRLSKLSKYAVPDHEIMLLFLTCNIWCQNRKTRLHVVRSKEKRENSMVKNTIEKTAENWLQKTGKEISVSTFLEYTGIVRRYIIPELGKLTWQEISQEDINAFTDKLLHNDGKAGKSLAPSTVLHIRTVLRQIAIFAHKTESAPEFVFSDRIPGAGRTRGRCFCEKDISKLCDYIQSLDDTRPFGVMLSLYMGVRVGELCALQWKDIDLIHGLIHIQKSTKKAFRDQNTRSGAIWIIGSPKTETSYRTIPIPLKIWKKLSSFHEVISDEECYFLNGRADRFVQPRSYERSFESYLDNCGIPSINIHSLRHCFATQSLESGCSVKALSEMLGHASATTTLDMYVHPTMDEKRRSMDRLEKRMSRRGRRNSDVHNTQTFAYSLVCSDPFYCGPFSLLSYRLAVGRSRRFFRYYRTNHIEHGKIREHMFDSARMRWQSKQA